MTKNSLALILYIKKEDSSLVGKTGCRGVMLMPWHIILVKILLAVHLNKVCALKNEPNIISANVSIFWELLSLLSSCDIDPQVRCSGLDYSFVLSFTFSHSLGHEISGIRTH